MKPNSVFVGIALVLAMFTVSEAVSVRRYNGVEIQNLIDTVNNHATSINALQTALGTLGTKLNADTGVVDTNYVTTTTALADSLRR